MKFNREVWILIGIRFFAFGLFCFTIPKALAGGLAYQGEKFFDNRQYDLAIPFLTKAKHWDEENPNINYPLAISLWEKGSQSGDLIALKNAIDLFTEMTEKMPYAARPFAYLALSKTKYALMINGALTPKMWDEINRYQQEALKNEPTNAWIRHHIGINILTNNPDLIESEKQAAIRLIQKSIAQHISYLPIDYLGQPSPFLSRSLDLLWKQFHDIQILKSIVPKDFSSYQIFLNFLDKHQLWQYRAEVFQDYFQIQDEGYANLCRQGRENLSTKQFQKAYANFREAFWMKNWSYLEAKAGLLAAEWGIYLSLPEFHELLQLNTHKALMDIFSQEDENLTFYYPLLQDAIDKIGNNDLLAMAAYRSGDDLTAHSKFEKLKNKPLRIFQAQALAGIGQQGKAIEMLRPALAEANPDLRELSFLQKWDEASKDQAQAQIDVLSKQAYGADHWWGKELSQNPLIHKGSLNMEINLLPGKFHALIATRSAKGNKPYFGYVAVKLDGRDLGQFYLDREAWEPIQITAESGGGKHWLTVDFMNGSAKASKEAEGPTVELGSVQIVYTYKGENNA